MDNFSSNSILDKVMASEREETLASFNPIEIVSQLFRDLSSREQDILRRRFGLSGKDRETLEEIGTSYNITRERVRQVENTTVKNIKARPDFAVSIKPVELAVLAFLEKYGGLMTEEHLLSELLSVIGNVANQKSHLLFLLEKLNSGRLVRGMWLAIFLLGGLILSVGLKLMRPLRPLLVF
jgi:hypothetical protein